MTEPTVNYTVKEMLERMDERADERHAETQRSIRGLATRVDKLESDRNARAGWTQGRDKLLAATLGVTGVVMSLPAVIYYLGGR